MSEAELIDRFIDELHRNPKAAPPPGLDVDTASFVRALVVAEPKTAPTKNLQERVWHKALTQTESSSDSFNHASSRGTSQNVTYLKSNRPFDMEDDMNNMISLEPTSRSIPGTRPPEARYVLQYTATIAAVLLILALVGGVLIQMVNSSGRGGFPASALIATETPEAKPAVITAENVDQVQLLRVLGQGTINDVVWSPDGKTLALGSRNGIVWLYDPNALNAEPRRLEGHTDAVLSIAFSPDGKRLDSSALDNTMRLWNLETDESISLPQPSAVSIALSPDGSLLAAAVGSSIKLEDAATGTQIALLKGHEKPVRSVAFSPDGKVIVSGGIDQTVRVWDVQSAALLATLQGHEGTVTSVAFSPDGTMIASGSADDTVRLWDWNGTTAGAQPVILSGHTGDINKIVFSSDGKLLASASKDKTIRLWDTQSGESHAILTGHTDGVKSIAFSPDGKTLASSSPDETLRLWDVVAGTQAQQVAIPRGQEQAVLSAAFSPDGKTLVSGGVDGTVVLWDIATGAERAVLKGHTDWVNGVVFSPDGATVASASFDTTIRLWDVASGETRAVLNATAPAFSIAYSPDGNLLASGGLGGEVRLWDVTTGESRAVLNGHTSYVVVLAFSPDGKTLASASFDDTVRLWDVASGTIDKVLTGHFAKVFRLAFSPDGKTLASGGEDDMIRLWDVATGKQLTALEGHLSSVFGLGFSPDGSLLASGAGTNGLRVPTRDKTIRLWDVATGKQLRVLEGHTQSLDGTIFSPDGTLLVSFSDDGTIRIWGLPQNGG